MSVKDSMTMAALLLLAEQVGHSQTEIVVRFRDFLNELSKSGVTECDLNQPMNVTYRMPSGFAKKAMVGGETFLIVFAYLGKRDGVIIQARRCDDLTSIYEFPASVAENALEGYQDIVDQFVQTYGLTGDTDSTVIEARKEAQRIEDEAHQAALLESRMQDRRFGSW